MQVDGQLKSAQLEQVAEDAPTLTALGRMYLNTKDALAIPFLRGLSRWERILTDSFSHSTKTASYTLTMKDHIVFFNAAGGSLIPTLPATASCAGKVFEIIRTDTVIANDVTVTPAAPGETIDGTTTFILKTKRDRIRIMSDGLVWQLLEHTYDEGWNDCTPAVANWVANTTVTMKYRRKGKCIDAQWNHALTGAPDALSLILGMPSGFKVDTTAMVQTTQNKQFFAGNVLIFDAAPERYHGWAAYNDDDSLAVWKDDGDGTVSVVNATAPMTFATGDSVCSMISDIPIIKLR